MAGWRPIFRALGCVGTADGIRQYVSSKIDPWVQCLDRLAEAARAYPKSAYSAFTRSVSCEWAYLQRVVNGCDVEFQRLRDTIRHVFTPAVVGRGILEKEHDLLGLPARFGGLALVDPVKTASQAFAVSEEATRLPKDAVFTGADINMADHMAHCQRTVTAAAKERKMNCSHAASSQLIASPPPLAQRTVSRIVKGNASGWLTVLPL